MINLLANAVVDKLHELFPQPVFVAANAVSSVDVQALPSELVLQDAHEKRQREFAAGRLAARDAIAASGHEPVFPTVGRCREPVWPDGLVGSIAHSDDVAVAVVALSGDLASIGIDVEGIAPLATQVASRILTATETAWLHRLDEDVRLVALLSSFSFKESIYKCVFPLHRQFIDFVDVEVSTEQPGLSPRCVDARHGAADLVAGIRGDSGQVGDHVVSACWLCPSVLRPDLE
jgi:phosphopantetheine--protein transferase-like protein